jgi:septal ring factor EnvC (AmiA/AmiB activator)
MLIASLIQQVFNVSVPVFIIEIIGAGFAVFGFINFFRHNNVKAQLAAKDAVIETNQQTIEAIEDRLKAVEDQLADVKTKNTSLTDELRDWESKYRHLENFAAPALGERLIKMFERQEDVLDKIVVALEGIQNRIDALESQNK